MHRFLIVNIVLYTLNTSTFINSISILYYELNTSTFIDSITSYKIDRTIYKFLMCMKRKRIIACAPMDDQIWKVHYKRCLIVKYCNLLNDLMMTESKSVKLWAAMVTVHIERKKQVDVAVHSGPQ
jgi:hypothetical protein